MEKESKIIIIRGNSGSGKTTLAKKLQKKLGHGTLLISQDVIRREMLWVKDGFGTKAIPLLLNLIMFGMNNCDFIILEGILNASWYEDVFEEIRSKFSSVYAYYYDLPFYETLARHQTKPNKEEFGETELKLWWNEKDYSDILPEKTLTKDLSLSDAIDMIYADVMGNA